MFYGLWVLIGIAMAGALYEPCFSIVTRTLKGQAHGAITSITLFAGFSGTISFLMANYLAENFSLKVSFLCFGLLVIFIGAPCSYYGARKLEMYCEKNDPDCRKTKGQKRPVVKLNIDRRFVVLALAFSIFAFVQGALLNHLLPLFIERGLANEQAVFLLSLIGPMQVLGRLAVSVQFLPPIKLMMICYSLLCGAVLLLIFVGTSKLYLYSL